MAEITFAHYLAVAAILFVFGVFGIFINRNVITILMSIELILLSVSINLVAFSGFSAICLDRYSLYSFLLLRLQLLLAYDFGGVFVTASRLWKISP